ncbi:MAG: SBBP repeat-containing protein [Terriglobia bacterium]|jgi:RHS repeat-associated protein
MRKSTLLSCLLLAILPLAVITIKGAAEESEFTSPKLVAGYGKLPLSFEANQGQTDARVRFLARGGGYTIFLTDDEAVLTLGKSQPGMSRFGKFGLSGRLDAFGPVDPRAGRWPSMAGDLESLWRSLILDLGQMVPEPGAGKGGSVARLKYQPPQVMRMRLVGGNTKGRAVGLDKLPGRSNYFIGNDPKKWRTNVPTYAQVTYQGVYPGIDLVYYGNQGELEYDFVVAPGADPSRIQLAFDGADQLTQDGAGNLVAKLGGAKVHLRKPIVYQPSETAQSGKATDHEQRTLDPLDGKYILKPTSQVAFEIAPYDRNKPLIIDPVLTYSTYLGGGNDDWGLGIAVDTAGNAYVTGYTGSTNFPVANPLQAGNAGGYDAFVTKLNAAGSALVYSTYLGGGSDDYGARIAVDSAGNAYLIGSTYSTDFPTVNPLQAANAGFRDAFVAKLNAAGSALVYSTYLGGGSDDIGRDIAVDSAGNAYVTGQTLSTNFPTASPLQAAYSGGYDAFVTKLNAAGSALVYSTYLGGSNDDYGMGIAVDVAGNAYVTGQTTSGDFPTASPFQAAKGGWDAFVTKVNSTGAALMYSTYLGGSNDDGGLSIAVDSAGNAYVTGGTDSTDFPTANPLQAGNAGGEDAFVAKLNAAGSALVYSTYLGGGQADYGGYGIAVDSAGNAYLTGFTQSTDFPTANALQALNAGDWDVFVTKLNSAGSALAYSTYLGGSRDEYGYGIAVDRAGNAYVTGRTASTDFPTANPLQAANAGGYDAFVAKILPGAQVVPGPTPPPLGIGGTTGGTAGSTAAYSDANNTTVQPVVAEPVSTGNGNYYYQHTDFTIPGRGLPLLFQRTYNALDNYAGPLGANWTHCLNIILSQTAAGVATIRWGDGHGEAFTLTGGVYVPQPGVFSTLVANPDGTFLLTQKNQTRYLFSATGSLTSVVDKNGNTIHLTYNGSGNLTQITDTVGRDLTLSYDGSNRITQVADPIGRTILFSYSGANDLTHVTDAAGGVTQYAYDASHHVTSITLPNSQNLLQNTYDGAGRVITQTNGRGFTTTFAYNTPSPGQTTITDARGKSTVHTYDASLRIMTITDALSGVVSYTYDATNDRTSVTNQNGKATSFTYDGTGNLTGITDPLVNSSLFTYDAKNNLLTATNPKGRTTNFAYDAIGNLLTIQDALANITKFAYDGYGQLKSKTDAKGNLTVYGYDAFGNLTKITDALGHITTLAYDGVGRMTSITDPNGHTASASYDALSRLIKVADPLGHQTQFAYDAVGNLLKITDANGHVTTYGYDAVNNLVTVTDALGHVTQYAYDANSNRTTFTNAKGNATSYTFDNLNRLSAITDPLSFVTKYAYDPVGNVTAVKDANGKTNQFVYDALNRLLNISYADGKNVTYAYDADGNRTSMADSHGTTGYAYDALDRLTSVANPGGKTVIYGYDAVGNRNSLTYPDGKVTNYAYDAANRLAGVTDWLAKTTRYSYDPASNLLATAYPNKTAISFAYDAANRLTSVANSMPGLPPVVIGYALDAVGNRTKEAVNGVAEAFGYDGLNELTSAQLGPLTSAWTYDAVGNRLKQTSPVGATSYTYDAGDRLLTAGQTKFTYDNNGNQITKTSGSLKWTNTYDAANRLIKALGYGVNSTFGYDGDGNRIAQTNGPGSYSYLNDVAAALPVVLNEQGPDGNITYAYGLGLIEEYSSAFNNFYHYDGLGSVIGLTNAKGALQAAYVYDPWGNALLSATDLVGTRNKFRFTGEALDPGTGLYYLRARYYDPTLPRFTGRDRSPGFPLDPLTSNPYLYALSNPNRYADPSGLSIISIVNDVKNFFKGAQETAAKNDTYNACLNDIVNSATPTCTNPGQLEEQRNRSLGKTATSALPVVKDTVTEEFDPSLYGWNNPVPAWAEYGWDVLSAGLTSLKEKVEEYLTVNKAEAAGSPATAALTEPQAPHPQTK